MVRKASNRKPRGASAINCSCALYSKAIQSAHWFWRVSRFLPSLQMIHFIGDRGLTLFGLICPGVQSIYLSKIWRCILYANLRVKKPRYSYHGNKGASADVETTSLDNLPWSLKVDSGSKESEIPYGCADWGMASSALRSLGDYGAEVMGLSSWHRPRALLYCRA